MLAISAEVQLRPTRIGFLVRPNDIVSVRTIMRACACLWGGVYNPIIPVFKRAPKEWQSDAYNRFKSSSIARGYVRYFEPDVYVEAEAGLLEKADLGSLRKESTLHSQVITLQKLFEAESGRALAEPEFGLNVHDALSQIYKSEQQFLRRDKCDAVLVKPERGSALVESMFGVYLDASEVSYIEKAYLDVYKPDKVSPNADTWRSVFINGAATPLRTTQYGLDVQRSWHHDLVLFVFDPSRATDLIDLWNLRLEPRPILPIPVEWCEVLAADIYRVLKAEHRPVVGNPNGVMHHATVEFGRSIQRSDADAIVRKLKGDLPRGALVAKHWRNPIWVDHRDDPVFRDGRLKVVAKERSANLELRSDGGLHTSFETLAPEFAARYGRGDHRWINVLRISKYSDRSIASVLPFNTFDRAWPTLGLGQEPVPVGSEGWVFPQGHMHLDQYVSLLSAEDALIGSLSQFGIEAKLSEPGHIAKQMLEHLGGLWGVYLLADLDTLRLLNKMAGGLRRKRHQDAAIEENFELRTAALRDWTELAAQRKERWSLSAKGVADFTSRNVIRLGLETDCPHCKAKNWSTLTSVDYRITCERCLKPYEFPQAGLRDHNRNWTYRVVGPFSVPDYGRGSYSALLALRVLDRCHSGLNEMTFATSMLLNFDGIQREVDFIAWRRDEYQTRRPPQLIIGEAKSLGTGELITASDLAKLRSVAAKLPEAVIVIAVLRDHFTDTEKKLLTKFVGWTRRANFYGEPTNPVVLLTSHELTMDHHLSSTWKALGGKHAEFSDFRHSRCLFDLADTTQQIYLDMRGFHQEREEYWENRHRRRKTSVR